MVLCAQVVLLACATVASQSIPLPWSEEGEADTFQFFGRGVGRHLTEATTVSRTVLVHYDKSVFPPDEIEWSGTGSQPQNEHYQNFTDYLSTAIYLGKAPEEAGFNASITKVARKHPPQKEPLCTTTPSLYLFNVGMDFAFTDLIGDTAEREVDVIEQSIKSLFRCLPSNMSSWVSQRQDAIAAIPRLRDVQWGSGIPEYVLQGTFDYKAIRVFDGDTIWAAVIVESNVWRINCRIVGIDTPEIPSSNDQALNASDAYFARDRLVELVTGITVDYNQTFTDTTGTELPSLSTSQMQDKIDQENRVVIKQGLEIQDTGKFGRYIVALKAINGSDVSSILLQEGWAKPY